MKNGRQGDAGHEQQDWALVLSVLFFPKFSIPLTTAFAAHPLITDDAGTLDKGTVQIELNGDIGTDKNTNSGHTTYNSSQIASTIGFGVTDKIDVIFG